MNRILGVIFSIAIGVLLYLVMILGINAFYPAPEYEDYCNTSIVPYPVDYIYKCNDNISVGECKKEFGIEQEKSNIAYEKMNRECNDKFEAARENYNVPFFIITAVLGLLCVIFALFIIKNPTIGAGIILAGVVLIFYGFAESWMTTSDKMKFVVALIDLSVIGYFAYRTLKNDAKPKHK